jgi:hypothetical protein
VSSSVSAAPLGPVEDSSYSTAVVEVILVLLILGR